MKIPNKVEPFSDTQMLLSWNSGESYHLPYFELRFACPCASCVDEHTGVRILKRDRIDPSIRVTGAQLVGRYAIQISFSDRHTTGMFHFDKLFDLCTKVGTQV